MLFHVYLDRPLFPHPYVSFSTGTQQDADKSTPARPPSTSTRPIVYVPPGFAASATRSNPRAQPGQPKLHASQSASGIAQPPLSTQGVHASGAHQQGRMSRDQSVTASNGQSAMLQRPPASGPYRPQTTPTQAAGRGPHPQSPDRPPGFGALPVPQSSGAHQLGVSAPPSGSGSWSHTSAQMQPGSHQASLACACCGVSCCA